MEQQTNGAVHFHQRPMSLAYSGGRRHGPVFTIHPDGRVELGEGVSLDEASRAFWDMVKSLAPHIAQQQD